MRKLPLGLLIAMIAAVPLAHGQSRAQKTQVAPATVTSHTTLRGARLAPTFTTSGKITPPANMCSQNSRTPYCEPGGPCKAGTPYCVPTPEAEVCGGLVAIRFKAGSTTVSLRRSKVDVTCHYTSRVTLRGLSRHTRLRVSVMFLGSKMLAPMQAKTQFVRFG